jgi:hypothetical protein
MKLLWEGNRMNKQIKNQIIFALEDDNEVMSSALGKYSDLDEENKQMNRELIEEHRKILNKLDEGVIIFDKDELQLIRDANEIHLNDVDNLNGHYKQAVALEKWLKEE